MSFSLLDLQSIEAIYKKGGILDQQLSFYEFRPSQQDLSKDLLEVFQEKKIAFLEAGTGVGKTLGYLLPAVAWAYEKQKKVLICTHTIPLQEQILKKEIPFLQQELGFDVSASLVKGMNNYLCLRKLEELKEDDLKLSESHKQELNALDYWSQENDEGCLSSLHFSPSPELWQQVKVDRESCNQHQCPHYQKCFYFKSRKKAQNAHLLIANHHLFFSDFFHNAIKDRESSFFLSCDALIFDEAHHLEETAIQHLSFRMTLSEFEGLLIRICSSSKGVMKEVEDRLHFLSSDREEVLSLKKEVKDLYTLFLPSLSQQLILGFEELFQALKTPFSSQAKEEGIFYKLRLRQQHFAHLNPSLVKNLIEDTQSFYQACSLIENRIKSLLSKEEFKALEGKCLQLQSLQERLSQYLMGFKTLNPPFEEEGAVYWLEGALKEEDISLNLSNLNISSYLKQHLYPHYSSVVFLSATLSSNQSFEFIKRSLGVDSEVKKTLFEHLYPSSFNYKNQSRLLCPSDLPMPSSPLFITKACSFLINLLSLSQGRAFLLFTSYSALNQFKEALFRPLIEMGLELFIQGKAPRSELLQAFKDSDKGVLLGTSSFWEGVDVVGEKLKVVVIAKLPFEVPSDPLVQARSEALEKQKRSPFLEDSLPRAVMRFKQGFGRLIRSEKDKGCVVCLDRRLIDKAYGKAFINSLPPLPFWVAPQKKLLENLQGFFKNYWSVTGSNR